MSIQRPTKTIPMPEGATVKGQKVSWTTKTGKRKIGKLTSTGRVLVESETWQIRYRDETGKEIRESTKLKNEVAAKALLAEREKEIERIRIGVVTRAETGLAQRKHEDLEHLLDLFEDKMYSKGCGKDHVDDTRKEIEVILAAVSAKKLSDVTEDNVSSWIAAEIKAGQKTPSTINSYIVSIKALCNWATRTKRLTENPLFDIKKLNAEVGRKKERRSLTEAELQLLIETAESRPGRTKRKREEVGLAYRLLAGMGLRSKELSLSTPTQFDFSKNRFTVKAAMTKNKKSDTLPVRGDLAARLEALITKNKIKPTERIFKYSVRSIYASFKLDCESAGIKMLGEDGRSIDVHSLRRTFGTMLARAGVPLTTTQKLMRHSTPELTAKLYIDVEPIDMMQAIEKLPNFS